MKNIIFIAGIPSFSTVLNMHYIYGCIKNGINVVYINAHNLLYPDADIEKTGHGELDDIEVSSLNDLERLVSSYNHNDTLCILQHPYHDINIYPIYQLIKKFKFLVCFFVHNPLPTFTPCSVSKKIKKLLLHPAEVFHNRLVGLIVNKKSRYKKFLCKPDFVFTSSPELKSLFDVESVKINYTDYDQFLKLNRSKDEDICVFLDSAITHHPDYYLFGSKCASNPNVYYNEINRIFAFIEKKFNLKVIIAGHPKSRYIGNEFCGRDIIVGDTLRLVSQSKLVLTHASLSINYAIYMYKKIIILTTGSYGKYIPDNESMLTLMESLNRELGIQLIDIMEKKYKIKNKSVCIDSYNIYKYKYSCWRAIENMDSEEIVTRYIKRL